MCSDEITVEVNSMAAPVCIVTRPGHSTVGELLAAIVETPEGKRLSAKRADGGHTLVRLLHGSRLLADKGCKLSTLLDNGMPNLELLLVCVPETEEVRKVRSCRFGVTEYLGRERLKDPELRARCCADKEAMMVAVEQNATCLQYASEALRDDIDIVTAAVRKNGGALVHASANLRRSRLVVMDALQRNGDWLKAADPAFRNDKEVVMEALRTRGTALAYASTTMQDDQSVVLAAVRQDGMALQFASTAMKADREVVEAAGYQNGLSLEFADEALRDDKDLVLAIVSCNPRGIKFASDRLKVDAEVIAKLNALAGR